jgi:hypothetical protein
MVSVKVLPLETVEILPLLKRRGFMRDFYLAGGTGLALQLEHRVSGDLDFFSYKKFNGNSIINTFSLRPDKTFILEEKSEDTVIGILDKVKLSFFHYPYPLLAPLKKISGLNCAGIADIACMKLDAISSRGTKRDFIDVYFIAKDLISLEEIFSLFNRKYKTINYNAVHIAKSLVYFKEADADPLPKMIKAVDWKEVKDFFRQEIKKIVKTS